MMEAPAAVLATPNDPLTQMLVIRTTFNLFSSATYFNGVFQLAARGAGAEPLSRLFHAAVTLLCMIVPQAGPLAQVPHGVAFIPIRTTVMMMRAFHHTFPGNARHVGVHPTPALLGMLLRAIAAFGHSPSSSIGFSDGIGHSLGFLLADYTQPDPCYNDLILKAPRTYWAGPVADLIASSLPEPAEMPDLMKGLARLLIYDAPDAQDDYSLICLFWTLMGNQDRIRDNLQWFIGYPGLMGYFVRLLRTRSLATSGGARDGISVLLGLFVGHVSTLEPALEALASLPDLAEVVDFTFRTEAVRNSALSCLRTWHLAEAVKLRRSDPRIPQRQAEQKVLEKARGRRALASPSTLANRRCPPPVFQTAQWSRRPTFGMALYFLAVEGVYRGLDYTDLYLAQIIAKRVVRARPALPRYRPCVHWRTERGDDPWVIRLPRARVLLLWAFAGPDLLGHGAVPDDSRRGAGQQGCPPNETAPGL